VPRRRRLADRARHRRALIVAVAVGALVYTIVVAPVNLCIRALGGSPSLLSPLHFEDKLRALGSFAIHWPKDLLFDHDDPKTLITAAAKRHRVPVQLALAVAYAESGLAPHRVSHAGAMGLMQLMPDTANDLRVADPFDSEQNIDGGVRYLADLWRRYRGDRVRVVAAYNAGPGAVPRFGALDLPGETRAYVRRVLGRRALSNAARPR
jgi:hypothetical protein